MSNKKPKLTDKQEVFVSHYLNTGNASESYRRAYDASNMNDASVNREAFSLLNHPKIAPRIEEYRAQAVETTVLTRAWVLQKLMDNATMAQASEDYVASNKALELLGKTDELQMFIERKHVESDNRHHHSSDDVSAFDGFIAEVAGSGAEEPSEKALPN